MGFKDMGEFTDKEAEKPSIDLIGFFYKHTCGAQDERDCSIMKHLILAEIRKSNAPAWVAEELEKKLYCRGCWNAMARRSAADCLGFGVQEMFAEKSRNYEPTSSENRKMLVKA
jgi:hypothetical protein